MYCIECGNEIPDNSKFCKYCGARITDEARSCVDEMRTAEQDAGTARAGEARAENGAAAAVRPEPQSAFGPETAGRPEPETAGKTEPEGSAGKGKKPSGRKSRRGIVIAVVVILIIAVIVCLALFAVPRLRNSASGESDTAAGTAAEEDGEETAGEEETEGEQYVTSLSQLTADGLESVDEWAREVYESEETRTEEQTLESFTNVGQYLLLPKDPETEGNILCMAYVAQIRTEHDGGDGTKYRKTDSVYWYISLKDVRQDEEGKLNIWETDFEIPEDTFTITFTSELAWTYTGYQTLDDLYRKAVTTHIDVYSHEDMSDESAVPEAEEEEVVTPENLAQQKASETGIYVSPSTSLAVCEITALSNSGSGVTVTWNAVEGASGYKVYRRTGSEIFSQIGTVDGGTAVSYTDQGVKDANGTSYTYAVTAVSGDIAGSYTEKSTVRLTAPALSDVKAGGSAGTLTVTWAASDKITGYQIQYSTDKDFKEGNQDTKVNGAGAVTSDLKSLTSGQTYYVRIRTYLTEGDSTYYSAWSSAKSAAAP